MVTRGQSHQYEDNNYCEDREAYMADIEGIVVLFCLLP